MPPHAEHYTTWIEQYRPEVVLRKRPAAAMKRPAAAIKRPAVAQIVSDGAAAASSSSTRTSTASVSIEGAAAIEAACGERYRREVSDLGLGLKYREMQEKLLAWGYAVSQEGCRVWLRQYRLVTKAKDGNHAEYAASKAHTAR